MLDKLVCEPEIKAPDGTDYNDSLFSEEELKKVYEKDTCQKTTG